MRAGYVALNGTNYLPFPIEISNRGGIGVPIYIQDQTTGVLDLPFLQLLSAPTLAVNAVVGSRTVNLSAGHSVVVGNTIELADSGAGNIFMQAKVLNVAANTITIDTPVNYAYQVGSTNIVVSASNMAVDGSVTPVVFVVKPLPQQKGDMVRTICSMTDATDMDFSTFGGMPALTNGCVMRVNNGNGTYRNIGNFKTNGDIARYSFDTNFYENKAISIRGFSARITWGSTHKHGVIIRLDGAIGESLEMVIQDDLTGLVTMDWMVQGSEVQGN